MGPTIESFISVIGFFSLTIFLKITRSIFEMIWENNVNFESIRRFFLLCNLKDTLSYFNSFLFFYLGRYCSLENFLDFKEGIVYQNLKPTKFKGMAFYFKNNAFYSFDNSYSQKSIIFSRKSLEINFEKKYSYNNFNGYENDFREYSKFRNLNTFYSSDDKIFILPELERQPINIEESSILIFDIRNGNLKNIKNFSNIAQINDCEKIRTFDDKQFQMVYENGKKLIEFGIDKMENFCICNSKEINKNFYTIRKLKYKQNKIYIGKNTQSKITQIIY